MTSIRYCVSHLLAVPLIAMERIRMKCSIQLLGVLDKLVLFAAVAAGMYSCWMHTGDASVIGVVIFGLLIFAFCGMLYYYFGLEDIAGCFVYLWFGCLLGMITFTEYRTITEDIPIAVTDAILLSSLFIKILWAIVRRFFGQMSYTSQLLTTEEKFQSLGFGVACVISSSDMVSLWLLVTGYVLTLTSLRLKAALSIPCLTLFSILCCVFFFQAVDVAINYYALGCFVGRLLIEPVIDLYFNGLTILERWQCLTNLSHLLQKFILLMVVAMEIFFFALAGLATVTHDEWYFAIPAYVLFGFLWISLHIVFIITSWTFINKLRECKVIFQSSGDIGNKTLSIIMSSRGMRFFTLIARRLVLSTLLSTLFLGAVMWQDHNAQFIASWLIVLPLEVLIHGLLHELGNTLGGTCTGYAVVGPSQFCRVDGTPVPLSTASVEEASSRSLSLLNIIQHFFGYHMIDIFSCDFSTSGLEFKSLESKLKQFFSRQMADGPRFDTYVLYYSGHVFPNGDWALAGDTSLKLSTLMEWWSEASEDSGSRLIIVEDVANTGSWVRAVQKESNLFIAIQTAAVKKSTDPETGVISGIGDFTREWVDYNCTRDSDITWREQGRRIKAIYATSKCWGDFAFHQPTDVDIEEHWKGNFPRITHPLIKFLQVPGTVDPCSIFSGCWSCLKRWKMRWLPPMVLDTRHGFRLVRS